MLASNITPEWFTPTGLGHVVSVLIVILEVLYVVFAFLVSRQVSLMNSSFTTKAAGLFVILANFHLLAAIILTALSVLTLF